MSTSLQCDICFVITTTNPSLTTAYICLSVRINEWKWRLFMFVSYIKRCLFADVKLGLVVGMTKQMSDGKKVDIVNY